MKRTGVYKRAYSYVDRIGSGVALNIAINACSALGLGFAALFFKLQGVSLFHIMSIWAISSFAAILPPMICRSWKLRQNLILGALCYTGMALSLVFFTPYTFIIYGMLNGLTNGLYWVSLNYIFFNKSGDGEHGKDSSIYFIIPPTMGIIFPPLGALLAHWYGFETLFLLTALITLIPIGYLAIYGSRFSTVLTASLQEADCRFVGLRLYTAVSAALYFFPSKFMGVYVLLFLHSEFQVGLMHTYLALISLVVAFYIADVSDRSRNRILVLKPLQFFMALVILLMALVGNVLHLLILLGVYVILDHVSSPLRFALPMDIREKDIGFWRMSEVYGNLGRLGAFTLATLLLYVNAAWAAFILFAILAVALPYLVKNPR